MPNAAAKHGQETAAAARRPKGEEDEEKATANGGENGKALGHNKESGFTGESALALTSLANGSPSRRVCARETGPPAHAEAEEQAKKKSPLGGAPLLPRICRTDPEFLTPAPWSPWSGPRVFAEESEQALVLLPAGRAALQMSPEAGHFGVRVGTGHLELDVAVELGEALVAAELGLAGPSTRTTASLSLRLLSSCLLGAVNGKPDAARWSAELAARIVQSLVERPSAAPEALGEHVDRNAVQRQGYEHLPLVRRQRRGDPVPERR